MYRFLDEFEYMQKQDNAINELARIRRGNIETSHPLGTCCFAHVPAEFTSKTKKYIVLLSDGTIAEKMVSEIIEHPTLTCDGTFVIALRFVSHIVDVQKTSTELEKSKLVADLRKAWKEGKFAPVIVPSSR
jgi:hypothetical protein